MSDGILVACHDCAMVQRVPELPKKGSVRCRRCSALLFKSRTNNIDRPLALYITGMIFFILSNTFPLLTLKFEGQSETTTLLGGVVALYQQGTTGLAFLVLLTTIVVPFVQLGSMTWALVALKFHIQTKSLPRLLRLLVKIYPWGMLEVFMLGIFVAVVKLADMAGIVMGVGVYCFGALIFIVAAAASSMDIGLFWERIVASPPVIAKAQIKKLALISCHSCHFLSQIPPNNSYHSYCPRCGAKGQKIGDPSTKTVDKLGRFFSCPRCHYTADRDYIASINIYRMYQEHLKKRFHLKLSKPVSYRGAGSPRNRPRGAPVHFFSNG